MDGRLVQPVVAAVLLGPGAQAATVSASVACGSSAGGAGEGAGHAVEHPAGAVTLPQRRRGHRLAALDRERAVTAQEEPFRPTERGDAAWDGDELGTASPYSKRGRQRNSSSTVPATASATRTSACGDRGRSGGRGRRARTRARR